MRVDVAVDVELGIVSPIRQVKPERNLDHAPAKRRHQVDPRRDHAADILGGQSAGGVVNRQPGDVAMNAPILRSDELSIERSELTHRRLPEFAADD